MKTKICTLALVLTLSAGLLAQGGATYTQTLPLGYDSTDGNYTVPDGGNFGASTGQRWQYCYRWTNFQHRCPITITGIALRNNNDNSMSGGIYTNVTVQLASSLNTFNTMSTNWTANLDPADALTVYLGDVTIPQYTAAGAATAPFNVAIPFNTGVFYFDPSRQRDLVIDITTNGGVTPGSGFAADGVFSASVTGSQTGHRTDPTAAAANWQNYDACAVIEITYELGSPVHFETFASTSGNGIGDFFLQLNNIPAGTTEGFTLVSLLPNVGVFGTGPVFGLFPDFQVFISLASPASLGNPFHWTYPAITAYPDLPIAVPPGTLSYLAGNTWNLVSVALDANGNFAGQSAPIAVTF